MSTVSIYSPVDRYAINSRKLAHEVTEAVIAAHGIVPDVVYEGKDMVRAIFEGDSAPPGAQETLDAIIAAHVQEDDWTDDPDELTVKAIPGWANWTEADALDWHAAHVEALLPVADLATANAVLESLAQENRALVRIVLAMRNRLWPALQRQEEGV